MNKVGRNLLMFILGCAFYTLVEMLWRGYSFRLMSLSGGLIFVAGGLLNDRFSWKMDLLLQCGIISVMITMLEAIVGNIDYYFLHLNMWSYSSLKYNYLHGKVSPLFSFIWFIMGFALVIIHDAITYYWLHDNDRPEYWIFGKRLWQMPVRKCEVY